MITSDSLPLHYGLPYLTVCGAAVIVFILGAVDKVMRLRKATRGKTDFFARYERLGLGMALLTEGLAVTAIVTGLALLPASMGLAGYIVVVAAYSLNDEGEERVSLFSVETLRMDLALVGLLVVLLTIAYSLRLAN
jgi:uncharacterized membrane protein YphA (DoxX/SURF4 family)